MGYRAFIVDDERMARGNLLDALRRHEHWTDIRSLASGKTLLADVARHRPHAVFLDIQMPGDDGMTLAQKLSRVPSAPLIVFVTAHSQYAVAAFELYAVDYLLKPFDDERFAHCITRLESALTRPALHARALSAQSAWASRATVERIVIKSSTSIRVIEVDQIDWITANGNYVDIHHADGTHLLRTSLKQILASLPESLFVQVHRRYVVRLSLIREIRTVDGERSEATLASGDVLPVGKSYRPSLLSVLCD